MFDNSLFPLFEINSIPWVAPTTWDHMGLEIDSFSRPAVRPSHLIKSEYRNRKVKTIPNYPGVYLLIDVKGNVLYVGKSENGIRGRAQRHLTGVRSDLLANKLLDVDDIAFIVTFAGDKNNLSSLEDHMMILYHPLLNQDPPKSDNPLIDFVIHPPVVIQTLPNDFITEQRHPDVFNERIFKRCLAIQQQIMVKDTSGLRRTLMALFRLIKLESST
jgi:hypothetical protein